jgi:sec-independent protein translocase protein TatB
MPTIGWFEILIIVVVAIIIVGPKDFPLMLKKVGSWIGSIKRYVNNVQREVSSITEDTIEKNMNEDSGVNTKKDKDEQKSD